MTKMISDMKKIYSSIDYTCISRSRVISLGHYLASPRNFPACLYLGVVMTLGMVLLPFSVHAEAPAVSGTKTKEAVKNTANSDKVATSSSVDAAQVSTVVSERSASASEWVIKAEQWELVRDGESILALPALNTLVNNWLKDKDKLIEVQYPGGEEGEFWVHQLIDWLVALGIPSDRLVTVRGSGADDIIRLNLIK